MSSSPSAPRTSFDFEQLTPVAGSEPAPSLESAAAQARALLAAAEAEAARIREEARATGHAEGFAAGREQVCAELGPAAHALAEALRSVTDLQGQTAERVEREAVEFAVQLAQKVVAGAIAVQPDRLLDVVRGALRTIVERERVTVLVHPDDLGLMRQGLAEVTGSLGGIDHLEVQEERRVGRGGAILRTSLGEVDARVEAKLERAREVVVEDLGR
jgi:flagellar assembly protein FliH